MLFPSQVVLKNFIENFIKIVSTDKLLNMVPLTILIILFIITEINGCDNGSEIRK